MNKIYHSVLFFFLGLSWPIFNPSTAYSQQFNFNDYVQTSPKSPNAAALGQYGDIPVSYYTGVPDIQIPIYDIKVGGISIPISLSYHASGIKVEDYPSWVGTGWALNAGGVINRQQRGGIDETMIDNYTTAQTDVNNIINDTRTTSVSGAFSASANNLFGNSGIDTESDIFNYNFPGGAGKFYLDPLGNAYGMPANKLKIVPSGRIYASPGSKRFFQLWTVTDNQGIKYLFGNNASGSKSTVEVIGGVTSACTSETNQKESINSWFLAEIDFPNGKNIVFNYEMYNYCIPQSTNYTKYLDPRIIRSLATPYQQFTNFTTALRLSSIVFPNGKVEFIAGGYRNDLPMDKVLDKINIYNQTGETYNLLKTYQLLTNNPANVTPHSLTSNDNAFRLNLNSVVIYNRDMQKIGAYEMKYQGSGITVNRNSNAQDFWGYYNGRDDNTSLIPILYNRSTTDQHVISTVGDANRACDPGFSQFDILTEIKYPTGGYTSFTFENNQAIPNDSRLLSFLDSPTGVPIGKIFAFALDNTTAGNNSAYSPEFTVGNSKIDALFHVGGHVLPYGSDVCANVIRPGPVVIYENPCYTVSLYKKIADGTFITAYSTVFFEQDLSLDPFTTYKAKIQWKGSAQGRAYVNIDWNESAPTINPKQPLYVGGLRVSKTVSHDPVQNSTVTRTYTYLTDQNTSSGTIAALPLYSYFVPADYVDNKVYSGIFTVTSQSQSPIFNTSGSNVGYSIVTEYVDDNGTLGKNVYKFSSNDLTQPGGYVDASVIESYNYPFPDACSYEWRRGNLLSKSSYVNLNGAFNLVARDTSTYQFNGPGDPNYNLITNIKIVKTPVFQETSSSSSLAYYGDFIKYNTASEAFFTSHTTHQEFDSQTYNKSGDKNVDFFLDPNSLQSSSTVSLQSNGDTNTQQYQYAINYNVGGATDDAALGIKNLILYNQVKAPIEQLNITRNLSGQVYVTGGILFLYYKDKPLISQYLTLELTTPVLLSQFVLSNINSSGKLVYDSRYKLNTSLTYTPDYNVSQKTKYGVQSLAYQWGYSGQYPVAQAINTQSNDMFYDSFEESNGNSMLNDSKTGYYSHTGVYSKGLTGLNAGSYILSYWQKSDSSWILTTTTIQVTGSTYTISLNTQVDDIRFYPVGALMTSYTYDPLVGMTSMTDAKDETTTYEYDGFQRLMDIKDKDGNIVKHMDYHYQRQ